LTSYTVPESSSNAVPPVGADGMFSILKELKYENDFVKLGALWMIHDELTSKGKTNDPLATAISVILNQAKISPMESLFPLDYQQLKEGCRRQFIDFISKNTNLLQINTWLSPQVPNMPFSVPGEGLK
jgi:hypothetical protein